MSGISRFTVGLRRANDLELYPYKPNSVEYTYVASAVNIGLSMLEQDYSKAALAYLALVFDNVTLKSATFGGDQSAARRAIDWFVAQLRANTPRIIVDETLNNLDAMGYHPRMPWDGNPNQFPFHLQGIHLNAHRVRSMIAAGQGTSAAEKQRFRDFQFAFATTIVHEVGGHILITWLGNGRPDTPKVISAIGYDSGESVGEAGRFLEMRLFGGTTEFYRDPQQDDDQVGVPHQIDDQGWAWMISPNLINSVCTYNFTFPLTRTGDAVNPRHKLSMAHNSTIPAPVGSRDRSLMARQGSFVPKLRNLPSYCVRLSDVRQIPRNSGKRLAVAS